MQATAHDDDYRHKAAAHDDDHHRNMFCETLNTVMESPGHDDDYRHGP